MKKLSTPIILASASPRRQQLLQSIGLEFEVVVRDVDEYFPEDLHPRAVAVLISENKAKAYDDLSNDNTIITSDTIVVLDDQVIGKPADATEAIEMLKKLSGRTHLVITGVTIFHKGRFRSFSTETKVTFKELQAWEIQYYVDQFQPFDKAGSYGIQEWIGMIGITGIEGDYYNVMGMPVSRLYEELMPLME